MRSVPYRRKREGRTNYNKRLQLLVGREHRVVIRKSLKSVLVQIVDYLPDGDKVIASAHSRELKKYGLPYNNSNIVVAYLTGLLCGVKVQKAGIKSGIVDFGLQKAHPKGKLMAVVKGLADSGFKVPVNENAVPDEDRINGKHIATYAQQTDETQNGFSGYKSANITVTDLPKIVEQVKEKILAENK